MSYKRTKCCFVLFKGGNFMNMFLDQPAWVTALTTAVGNIINPILILVATAGIIYAVVVGVKFARAEDKGQRDEAKQKLITVIIGIVVTGVLIALFYWLQDALSEGGALYNSKWFGF